MSEISADNIGMSMSIGEVSLFSASSSFFLCSSLTALATTSFASLFFVASTSATAFLVASLAYTSTFTTALTFASATVAASTSSLALASFVFLFFSTMSSFFF
jgi:hypothetical protein